MLQYTTVIPTTLELLKKLMQLSSLQDFYLVGGTALALQTGQRISIDLDLFTEHDFDTHIVLNELKLFFNITDIVNKNNSLNLYIEYPKQSNDFVKIDILKYPYPLISNILVTEKIRMLCVEDIIPMKLSAITNTGAKKDFYDIYFLFEHYTLKQMLDLFDRKYPSTNHFQLLKSLTYFDNAETDVNPQTIKKISWKQVKNKIEKTVKNYLNA